MSADRNNIFTANWAAWLILGAALAIYAYMAWPGRHSENIAISGRKPDKPAPRSVPEKLKEATMTPGRVVQLNTDKGLIEFVLFEKDCPKTTKRIADLVSNGCYSGVEFSSVEPWVIQTDQCKEGVDPMDCEVVNGLTHAKGTVGTVRQDSPDGNTSSFYILLEPQPHMDMDRTNFGRLINGMDVAMRIKKGDKIRSASVRSLTEADKKRYNEVLTIEMERKHD